MELQRYCDNAKGELTNWKAKIYDLIREADNMPSAGRDKISGSIQDLHHIVGTIDSEIKRREKECPVEWQAEKEALEAKFKELEEKSGEAWRDLSPDDY